MPVQGRGGRVENTKMWSSFGEVSTRSLLRRLPCARLVGESASGVLRYRSIVRVLLLVFVYCAAGRKLQSESVDHCTIFTAMSGSCSPLPLTELQTGQALQARRRGDPSVPRRVREVRRRPRDNLPGALTLRTRVKGGRTLYGQLCQVILGSRRVTGRAGSGRLRRGLSERTNVS